jgi:hypothetical protein
VRDAHGGIRDVDVLPTGAARPVGVDPEVLVLNLDVHVVGQLGPDEHGGKRGVSPRRLIEGRDADQTMHARFSQHHAVGEVANQQDRRALDARLVAGLVVDDVPLEPAPLRPLQVHAQQHLGPVLRLGAAGARVDGDDRVGAIVLAAQHLLGLGGLDLALELVEPARQVGGDVLPSRAPLHEHRQVVGTALERGEQGEIVLDTAAALHDFLRLGLVAPEVCGGCGLLYLCELVIEPCTLKDASAVPPLAGSALRIAW